MGDFPHWKGKSSDFKIVHKTTYFYGLTVSSCIFSITENITLNIFRWDSSARFPTSMANFF